MGSVFQGKSSLQLLITSYQTWPTELVSLSSAPTVATGTPPSTDTTGELSLMLSSNLSAVLPAISPFLVTTLVMDTSTTPSSVPPAEPGTSRATDMATGAPPAVTSRSSAVLPAISPFLVTTSVRAACALLFSVPPTVPGTSRVPDSLTGVRLVATSRSSAVLPVISPSPLTTTVRAVPASPFSVPPTVFGTSRVRVPPTGV